MLRYLSDEWLAEADAALAGLAPLPGPLTVGFVVTDGPDGDRSYRISLGPQHVRLWSGRDDAPVALVQTWATARAIAQGERSAQRAFLDGDIRIEGDVTALLGQQQALAGIEDRWADLRSRTAF